MRQQTPPTAAKDLIETSRKTLSTAVEATCDSAHEALRAYDRVFTAGSDTLLRVQNLIGTSLRIRKRTDSSSKLRSPSTK